ncbi:Serine protease inhibitor dipetalogastin [Orchesella cincta]|uniref:Serine protease inhibitor dipetalogastin n=1 Tax=Orchesella cincta TaxID=48709 RepID=A0A1D2MTE3_ORCCI|nr:Serine protease inhibitor dipetalogastin [Orchesella cincta]
MHFTVFTAVLLFTSSLFLLDSSQAQRQRPCVCGYNLQPVCGTNGRTYSNPCLFKCDQQRYPNLRIRNNGYCREGIWGGK